MKLENRKKCYQLLEQLSYLEILLKNIKNEKIEYFSLGSIANTLNSEYIEILGLKEDLEKLKYKIIDELKNKIKDIEAELTSL